MNKLYQALKFAEFCHVGQKRKYSGVPYINHPARVGGRALLLSEEAAIAGFCHDIVEDTNHTFEEIEVLFGKNIKNLVFELTNASKFQTGLKNRAEKKAFDRSRLSKASPMAQNIKCIDRIDNLRELDFNDGFAKLYIAESEELYKVLISAEDVLRWELRDLIKELKEKVK